MKLGEAHSSELFLRVLAEIREQIADLPSYGYRRACDLANRRQATQDGARVNPKRAYRVMVNHGCCCPSPA